VTVAVPHYNKGAFLPDTLASLAAQTYPHLEVIVIDDGSTDPASREVFAEQERLYPQFRFLRQDNAGLGATRNRALAEGRGEFFLPVDADNVALPEMVERFVKAALHRPDAAALTCYFLAFEGPADLGRDSFAYATLPTGGPHVLGSLVNVYGDGNALFRARDLHAVGGFETDRDTGYEDWEGFVKLVNAGYRVDVLPEYLFHYRHVPTSMLRVTSPYLNQRRVLRQYQKLERLPPAERIGLWTALFSLYQHVEALEAQLAERWRRYDGARADTSRLFDRVKELEPRVAELEGRVAELEHELAQPPHRLVSALVRRLKKVPLLAPTARAVEAALGGRRGRRADGDQGRAA
jgi:glycosyltransferase involved in cell wall biosynthesis